MVVVRPAAAMAVIDRSGETEAREAVGALGWNVEQPWSGTFVVTPHGELDAHSSPDLRRLLAELCDGAVRLVVDLTRVGFLDSSALGVLIATLKRQEARGGTLAVVVPATPVRRIFEITALDRVLKLFETRADALAADTASS